MVNLEQLRSYEAEAREHFSDDAGEYIKRAAEEIEFLRTVRTEIMAQVKGVCDINGLLEKRIERLRAALTKAREYLADIGHHPEPGDTIKMIDAALGNEQQEPETK